MRTCLIMKQLVFMWARHKESLWFTKAANFLQSWTTHAGKVDSFLGLNLDSIAWTTTVLSRADRRCFVYVYMYRYYGCSQQSAWFLFLHKQVHVVPSCLVPVPFLCIYVWSPEVHQGCPCLWFLGKPPRSKLYIRTPLLHVTLLWSTPSLMILFSRSLVCDFIYSSPMMLSPPLWDKVWGRTGNKALVYTPQYSIFLLRACTLWGKLPTVYVPGLISCTGWG